MRATFIALLACLLQIASAQESEQDSSDVMDEIVVQGEKSLSRLRHRVYEAEDVFYVLFNSINDVSAGQISNFKRQLRRPRVGSWAFPHHRPRVRLLIRKESSWKRWKSWSMRIR